MRSSGERGGMRERAVRRIKMGGAVIVIIEASYADWLTVFLIGFDLYGRDAHTPVQERRATFGPIDHLFPFDGGGWF